MIHASRARPKPRQGHVGQRIACALRLTVCHDRWRRGCRGSEGGAAGRRERVSRGVDSEAIPHLEPAFVVDAPPKLPGSGSEHWLAGHTECGTQLFSRSFEMPAVADGDGSSSFAFVSL